MNARSAIFAALAIAVAGCEPELEAFIERDAEPADAGIDLNTSETEPRDAASPDLATASFGWRPLLRGPRARERHAMVYDTRRREVMIFGGIATVPDAGNIVVDDTLSFDGERWEELSPPNKFRVNVDHAAAEDKNGNIVMFGGATTNYMTDPRSDTWIWDGITWTEAHPDPHPSARRAPAMAYDPLRKVAVLYGGSGLNGEPLDDTWEWDGERWHDRTPPESRDDPEPRSRFGMVFDTERGRIVMFGGEQIRHGNFLNDLWSWDGERWKQIPTRFAPTGRASFAMGYDSRWSALVIFGGEKDRAAILNETWMLTGDTWTQLDAGERLDKVRSGRMVYDRSAERLVMFGGFNVSGGPHPDLTFRLEEL